VYGAGVAEDQNFPLTPNLSALGVAHHCLQRKRTPLCQSPKPPPARSYQVRPLPKDCSPYYIHQLQPASEVPGIKLRYLPCLLPLTQALASEEGSKRSNNGAARVLAPWNS